MNTESSSIADTLNYALFFKTLTGGVDASTAPQVPGQSPKLTGLSTSSALNPVASQSYSSTSSANPVSTESVSGSTTSTVDKGSSNKILKYAFYVLLIFLAYSYFTSISFKKTRLSRSISRLSKRSVSKKAKAQVVKPQVVKAQVVKVNVANSRDSKSIESAEYQQIINKYLKNYK
jgi:hypothetical protein